MTSWFSGVKFPLVKKRGWSKTVQQSVSGKEGNCKTKAEEAEAGCDVNSELKASTEDNPALAGVDRSDRWIITDIHFLSVIIFFFVTHAHVCASASGEDLVSKQACQREETEQEEAPAFPAGLHNYTHFTCTRRLCQHPRRCQPQQQHFVRHNIRRILGRSQVHQDWREACPPCALFAADWMKNIHIHTTFGPHPFFSQQWKLDVCSCLFNERALKEVLS